MTSNDLSRLIRDARDSKGWTQPVLARRLEVATRTVSRWETGVVQPPWETLGKVAEVLGIELEDLENAAGRRDKSAPSSELYTEAVSASQPEDPARPDDEDPAPGRVRLILLVVGVLLVVGAAIFLLGPRFKGASLDPSADATEGAQTPSPGVTQPDDPVVDETPTRAGSVVRAVLGRDIKPDDEEPCGLPTIAAGGSWVFGSAELDGTPYEASYRCSMLAGASGTIDFSLGKQYSTLRVVTGYLSGSAATQHSVEFAFVKDGRFYVVEPYELRYGESRTLDLDVKDVTQISVRLTETSAPGGSEAPSTPVVAALQLS